jgi:hypothetical protein
MSLIVTCPGCDSRLKVAERLDGKARQCPKCGHRFTVPPALNIDANNLTCDEETPVATNTCEESTDASGPGESSATKDNIPEIPVESEQFDKHQKLSVWIASGLILFFSLLFIGYIGYILVSIKGPLDRPPPEGPAQLGKPFTIGNLEITPKTIEFDVHETTIFGMTIDKTNRYVLTFVATNKSEGQVFQPNTNSSAVDNFGNECMSFEYVKEGNKELRPGDSVTIEVALEQVIETATKYRCYIFMTVSNDDDDRERWWIRFSPADIPVK